MALTGVVLFAPLLYFGLRYTTAVNGTPMNALGFFSWNAGIKYLGAGGAMVFYNTLPLYGALFGFLFLGETLGPAHLAGGLVAALRKKTVQAVSAGQIV